MDRKGILTGLAVALASVAAAFPEVPRASADALGVTKNSRPINSGIVFVNGKFLPPPYTVARWGTGLRVNGCRVSGQIIPWDEFIRTQSGARVEKPAAAAPPAAPAAPAPVELAPEPGSDDDLGGSLDDLFDDDASAKKPKAKKSKPVAKRRKVATPRPAAATYSLTGDFAANAASKALVAKINAVRSEIDRTLRMGGFVLFGDAYSRISGDARTAERLMETIPGLLQSCETPEEFAAEVKGRNLVFLNGPVCGDLYRNRIDYLKLREQNEEMKRNRELRGFLDGSDVL